MKILSILTLSITLIGTQILASGCSEMAAFDTKVNNFLETANLNDETKSKINQLSKDCKNMHDMGMAVNTIDSCKEVISMVGFVYILEKYHLFIQLKKKPYLYKLLYQKKIFGFIVNNLRRYIFIK